MDIVASKILEKIVIPEHVAGLLKTAKTVKFVSDRMALSTMVVGSALNKSFEVCYDVNGKSIGEAVISRCKNGFAVNYPEP